MAKRFEVIGILDGGGESIVIPPLPVKAGAAASIASAGIPVIVDGSNAGYAKVGADPVISTDNLLGISSGMSTDTASADGTVQIYAGSKLLIKAYAKTPASLTAAKVLTANKYQLDLTNGDWTFDESTTTNGVFKLLQILDSTTGLCLGTITCNGL